MKDGKVEWVDLKITVEDIDRLDMFGELWRKSNQYIMRIFGIPQEMIYNGSQRQAEANPRRSQKG